MELYGIVWMYGCMYVCMFVCMYMFLECIAKGSRFTFGGLGVDTCSCDPAFGVRNRPCAAVVRLKLPCLWGKPYKRVFL